MGSTEGGRGGQIHAHMNIPGGSLLATSGLNIGYSEPNVPLLGDALIFNRAAICVKKKERDSTLWRGTDTSIQNNLLSSFTHHRPSCKSQHCQKLGPQPLS